LITSSTIESAPLITHYNLFRTAEINGNPKDGYSSGQALQALREVADKVLPAGYGYEFSGLSLQEINAGSSTVYIFSYPFCLYSYFLQHCMKAGPFHFLCCLLFQRERLVRY